MPFIWDIVHWVKGRAMYMAGRGLLSMALILAASYMPFTVGLTPFSMVAVAATGLLQGALIWRDQRRHEDRLLQEYRGEVAAKLGRDPAQVTVGDLHTVANGAPEAGLESNPVISEAINHNSKKQLVRMMTTVVSAILTFGGLLLFAGAVIPGVESVAQSYADLIGSANPIQVVGAMLVSGTGMGIVNGMLDRVAEPILRLNKKPANHYIREIRKAMKRNKLIAQEQVFGVFVAADSVLSNVIKEAYGKDYHKLSSAEQSEAMAYFGSDYHLAELTDDLNNRQIEADELAFAAVGQRSGVPRKPLPQELQEEKSELEAAKEELIQAVSQDYEQAKEGAKHVGDSAGHFVSKVREEGATNDNTHKSFAERVGAKKTEPHRSHAERVLASRSAELEDRDIT